MWLLEVCFLLFLIYIGRRREPAETVSRMVNRPSAPVQKATTTWTDVETDHVGETGAFALVSDYPDVPSAVMQVV